MRRVSTATACVLALLIAGCGGRDPVAAEANDGNAAAQDDAFPADENTSVDAEPEPGGGAVPLIPAALHGRWGMSPGDCTSTRGDAKGLLVISANRLRFYESVARPSPGVQTSDDSVSGTFAFTGEGTNWARYQTLEVRDGRLVRTVNDPTESYTYVRCD